MKRYALEFAVFICGAVVMVYEITGSRILAPYYGTTTFVWSTLIGVILASLSFGYWIGGRVSDKNPTINQFALIVLVSSIFICITGLFKETILSFFYSPEGGNKLSLLFVAIILFAPASILLGMVSPYAIRLRNTALQTTGKTVGNLYAISTIGSIIGTFLSGFVLIPLVGNTKIQFILSGVLALTYLILIPFRSSDKSTLLLSLIIVALSCYGFSTVRLSIIDVDSSYNRLFIYETTHKVSGKKIKLLQINDHPNSAIYPDSDSLVYPYTQFYANLAKSLKEQPVRILIFGGGGYTIPTHFHTLFPNSSIDVVEIDETITELAKQHFGLQSSDRMDIYSTDGRSFLNQSTDYYDLIIWDVFNSGTSVPFELTTLETVKSVYNHLNKNGTVMLNMIASFGGKNSAFMSAEYATYKSVFENCLVFGVESGTNKTLMQNIILMSAKQTDPMSVLDSKAVSELSTHSYSGEIHTDMILTDDFSPANYLLTR